MDRTTMNTNIMLLNSHRAMLGAGQSQAQASERLSTGQRINSAADDAASLAVSENLIAHIRGLDQLSNNAMDSINLQQTADGALQSIQDITHRIRDLTIQGENGTMSAEGRAAIDAEVNQLVQELESIVDRTQFNGQNILDEGVNLDLSEGAADLINQIDDALSGISSDRANVGALQNRLHHTVNNLQTASINTNAANSRIRDADMAREMIELARANMLNEAATSMQAQANQVLPHRAFQLLGQQ